MHRTLPEVLVAISVELASLADLAFALQTQIPTQAYSEDEIVALQSLDRLTQCLACLGPFVAALGSATTPCECGVRLDSALDQIGLSALARRLGGDSAPTELDVRTCELFE
jgi:hypothetical protein